MFILHIPKNTGFIYFRRNEHSARIHIATEAYTKRVQRTQSDSTGNIKSFLSKPIGPNEIAQKETKKNPKSNHTNFFFREYYRKKPKLLACFQFKVLFPADFEH